MVAVNRMSKMIAGSVRNGPDATQSEHLKLYAQAKEPKQKIYKGPAFKTGPETKKPASEPGNPHGKSGMRVPSLFRVPSSEVPGESNKKSGWGGSNPFR